MANGPFLLELNYNFNPLLQQTFSLPRRCSFPINFSCGDNNAFKLNNFSCKMIRDSPKLRTKCFVMSHNSKVKNGINGNGVQEKNEAVAISSGINEVMNDHHHGSVADTTTFEGTVGVQQAVGFEPFASYDQYCTILLAFCVGALTTCIIGSIESRKNSEKTSVLKLQIGLMGKGTSLQMDLKKIAAALLKKKKKIAATDTSDINGLSYVLEETTLSLLRHPEYCISGYSSTDMERDVWTAANRFNQLSVIERGKFDLDTLVNVNIRKDSTNTQTSKYFCSEYCVITIIVTARGIHKLPPINSSANLKEALHILATIPSWGLEAVAVLLTPKIEGDTVTEQNFLENYSLLCPL